MFVVVARSADADDSNFLDRLATARATELDWDPALHLAAALQPGLQYVLRQMDTVSRRRAGSRGERVGGSPVRSRVVRSKITWHTHPDRRDDDPARPTFRVSCERGDSRNPRVHKFQSVEVRRRRTHG